MASRVNLIVDDIPEGGQPLPEEEIYTVEFKTAEEKRSAKGPYLNCMVKIVDHPKHSGYTLFEILPLPDQDELNRIDQMPELDAATISIKEEAFKKQINRCFRTRQALGALGVPKKTPLSGAAIAPMLPGSRCQIKVYTDEWQGNFRSKIKYYVVKK